MTITWADIPGIVGYQVTPTGEVRSTNWGYPKVRKPSVTNMGYERVNLRIDGKTKWFLAHRLVAKTFLTPIEGKDVINHKDGNKRNNSVENLEWCTQQENAKHAFVKGLSRGILKAVEAHRILSAEQAQEIRDLKGKMKPKKIAEMYKVSIWTIYSIHANTRHNLK